MNKYGDSFIQWNYYYNIYLKTDNVKCIYLSHLYYKTIQNYE